MNNQKGMLLQTLQETYPKKHLYEELEKLLDYCESKDEKRVEKQIKKLGFLLDFQVLGLELSNTFKDMSKEVSINFSHLDRDGLWEVTIPGYFKSMKSDIKHCCFLSFYNDNYDRLKQGIIRTRAWVELIKKAIECYRNSEPHSQVDNTPLFKLLQRDSLVELNKEYEVHEWY